MPQLATMFSGSYRGNEILLSLVGLYFVRSLIYSEIKPRLNGLYVYLSLSNKVFYCSRYNFHWYVRVDIIGLCSLSLDF